MCKSVRNGSIPGAALAAILTTAPAMAADMSVKALPPSVPVLNWTGFYIGAHIGGGWDSAGWFEDGTPTSPGAALGIPGLLDGTVNASGVLGGGQAGYNYQLGSFVLGVEADGSGAHIVGSTACFPEFLATAQGCNTRVNALGTVTARVGTTYNNLLLYFVGGGAWENERLQNLCNVCGPGGTSTSAVFTGNPWGGTLGVGVEYALPAGWSAFLQYNYIQFFRGRDLTFDNAPSFTENIRETLSVLKLGVNYRFAWGPGLMRY